MGGHLGIHFCHIFYADSNQNCTRNHPYALFCMSGKSLFFQALQSHLNLNDCHDLYIACPNLNIICGELSNLLMQLKSKYNQLEIMHNLMNSWIDTAHESSWLFISTCVVWISNPILQISVTTIDSTAVEAEELVLQQTQQHEMECSMWMEWMEQLLMQMKVEIFDAILVVIEVMRKHHV